MDKILIVDDKPEMQELLKVTLEIGEYDVYFAENGWQAISMARTERPQIILLDVMMPDMNGLEVCRRLKAIPTTADIPVIMLSAKGQEDEIEAGLVAGAEDYVTKPFSPIDLISRIEKRLPKHNTQPVLDLAL